MGDWIKRSAKYQAFTVSISSNGKALELGTGCLISETFLYLSEVIHLIGRYLIGEVLQYILYSLAKATDMGTMMIRRFHEQHHTHTHRLIIRVEHQ